jgi:hypothetical protein
LVRNYDLPTIKVSGSTAAPDLEPLLTAEISLGRLPSSVRFSPDATRIAIGFKDTGSILRGTKKAALSNRSRQPYTHPPI